MRNLITRARGSRVGRAITTGFNRVRSTFSRRAAPAAQSSAGSSPVNG